jgi:non-homologous end joining protein Ku
LACSQLKYKSNVLFVASVMKPMGGRGEGSGDKMMDMMMKMLDDDDHHWGKKDHDDDKRMMEKMMKMLKAWMNEDEEGHGYVTLFVFLAC